MRRLSDFFKRIKVTEENATEIVKNIQGYEIQIEGNIDLFKDEKQKIVEGAKQLLEIGKAENMEDAIVTFAVMFRGLKFKEIRKNEERKKVIVLRETAQGITEISKDYDEIDL